VQLNVAISVAYVQINVGILCAHVQIRVGISVAHVQFNIGLSFAHVQINAAVAFARLQFELVHSLRHMIAGQKNVRLGFYAARLTEFSARNRCCATHSTITSKGTQQMVYV